MSRNLYNELLIIDRCAIIIINKSMKNLAKNFIIAIIVFLVITGIFSTLNLSAKKVENVDLQKFMEQVNRGDVQKITIEGDKLNITLADGTLEALRKETNETLGEVFQSYSADPEKIKNISIEVKQESGWTFWLNALLPFLLPLIVVIALIYYMLRQVQGANTKAMSFGQSGAREAPKNSKNRVTFKDVAGVKEAKEELLEVVEFLKNSKKFVQLGAKIPKGVLLMGSPGTGKTLLAKAVAGEANVPFFSISGSEFVEMFVGVGAARVRDLFQKAKKGAPCIIFIDELDAVGRQRGTGLGGSHDEREQTLNQILVEMDGFEANSGVIVLAATNRPDVLDPALLRPGRFDRRVILDEPDINDREAILKIHAKGKPTTQDVDLRKIAERTPGFSGADLANLLNEAAILSARRNKTQIGMDEIRESVEKVMLGPERKSHILSKKEKNITAYHEAAHALVAHEMPDADPVHKVSIVSRGRAAGYTLKLPIEDKHLHSRSEFIADLAVMLAGHTVEKEIFGEVTTGASSDLRQATRLARRLITEFGMSEKLGARTFGEKEEMIFLGREIHEQRDYSEKVAETIDQEISHLLAEATKTALEIIRKKKNKLEEIVKILLEKETIEKEDFEAIFK